MNELEGSTANSMIYPTSSASLSMKISKVFSSSTNSINTELALRDASMLSLFLWLKVVINDLITDTFLSFNT